MIYECDECEAVLRAGMLACPRCGQPFDDPVPADASLEASPLPARPESARRREPVATAPIRRRRMVPARVSALAATLAAVMVFSLAGALAYRHFSRPKPAALPVAALTAFSLPTDLAAHPQYPAKMSNFVRSLRATGVGVQWPAFGSSDMMLITPPTVVNGQRAAWDQETYQRLAQGIWSYFTHYRYESGFSDTDSTTCFVIVSSASGQIVAADLMGNIK